MRHVFDPLIALLLLLGVIGSVVFGVLLPANNHLLDQDARIADLKKTVSAFRDRLTNASTATVRVVGNEVLLPGASTALAAASMQELLDRAAVASGVEIDRLRVEAPTPSDEFIRIGLYVSLSGSIAKLTDLIYELESSVPYTVIDSIEIRRGRGRGGRTEDNLIVEMEVVGFAPISAARP